MSGFNPPASPGQGQLYTFAGTTHAFTPAQFHDFAVAVANFAAQCSLFAHGAAAAPSPTLTIA